MIAKAEANRLILNTRATPTVLAILPGLEGRRSWLKGGGLSIEDTPHNRSRIRDAFPSLTIEDLDGPSALEEFAALPLEGLQRVPDPHQMEALARMERKNAFGLFMEQGTGKTKCATDWACQLFRSGAITGILVVSKKGVHRQWIEAEVPKDWAGEFEGAYWNGKPLPDVLKKAGGMAKWFSINYDALRAEKGMTAAIEFARAHSRKLLIIADESQEIKNHKSIRHKRMLSLKLHSSHRLILTGTPIAKDLTDEWAQLLWLDEGIIGCRYITTFRAQYCIMGGYEGRAVIAHKNMDEFKSKVDPFTFRVTKDRLGLIPKRYAEWIYDLTGEQRRLIQQVKKELVADLETGETISMASATVAFGKVQQISNGFIVDEEGAVNRLMPLEKNPRINAALEWIEAGEGKAILWARFREDMAMLAEALSSAGISFVQYHGGVKDADRKLAIDSFMDPGGAQIFLANPQSAGTGLNLQGLCRRALYYSNSFAAIDRWQSEDRIHRRGTTGAVVYTDLIGKGSLDRYILRNLQRKKGISALSLGDVIDAFDEM